jgi:hypothetical protein
LVQIGHVWHLVGTNTVDHKDTGLPRGSNVERKEGAMVTLAVVEVDKFEAVSIQVRVLGDCLEIKVV